MLLNEVSELLEERKRKDYLESAYTQISCALPRGNAELWEAGVKLANQV